MPRITYLSKNFHDSSLQIIEQADQICTEYARQGYNLTLRQLYYQFVARDLLANQQTEYKRLGSIVTDARRAGYLDWNHVVDRTRNIAGGDGSMTDPAETIDPAYFSAALWEGQPYRVEVWVEKDALIDVVARGARGYRAAYFSCRGYTSDSEIWKAAQRMEDYLDEEGVEQVRVLHLGDHDPSGIDMTRDIRDRLHMFIYGDGYDEERVEIKRIALNMDQVDEYGPPPNPAKITDSRVHGYLAEYGSESWELDALEPTTLRELIEGEVGGLIDVETWNQRQEFEETQRATLEAIKDNYEEVVTYLRHRGEV